MLRARADLNAGRLAEAALQARVAIEALLRRAAAPTPGRPAHRWRTTERRSRPPRTPRFAATCRGSTAAALDEAVAAMEQPH